MKLKTMNLSNLLDPALAGSLNVSKHQQIENTRVLSHCTSQSTVCFQLLKPAHGF